MNMIKPSWCGEAPLLAAMNTNFAPVSCDRSPNPHRDRDPG